MSHDAPETKFNFKYSVFALGSTQYPTFCAFGKNIDKILGDLGAQRILPIACGDELKNQDQAFHVWAQECYKSSCKSFDLEFEQKNLQIDSFEEEVYDPKKYRIREVTNDESSFDEHHIHHELARLTNKAIIPCRVIAKKKLKSLQNENQTNLFRLKPSNAIAKGKFSYEPGDHFAVFPCNPLEVVNAILGHFWKAGYNGMESSIFQIEKLLDGKWVPDNRLPTCSLRAALTNYLDITTPPSPKLLEYLVDMANDRWDSYRLKKLATVRT